jgi:hypothetical protein
MLVYSTLSKAPSCFDSQNAFDSTDVDGAIEIDFNLISYKRSTLSSLESTLHGPLCTRVLSGKLSENSEDWFTTANYNY